jgi:hypothetical protein
MGIKRCVSLEPFSVAVIDTVYERLIHYGWKNPSFSKALNVILLGWWYNLKTRKDGQFSPEILLQLEEYLKGKPIDEREIEAFKNWFGLMERQANIRLSAPKHRAR